MCHDRPIVPQGAGSSALSVGKNKSRVCSATLPGLASPVAPRWARKSRNYRGVCADSWSPDARAWGCSAYALVGVLVTGVTPMDPGPLRQLLVERKIATMSELKAVLGTEVDMTVFRRLRKLNYRSS